MSKTRARQYVLLLIGTLAGAASATAFSPTELHVGEGFTQAPGFLSARPIFSWKLLPGSEALRQTAYQLIVASGPDQLPDRPDLWDSGRVMSSQSAWVGYGGQPLLSRQRVCWRVRIWNQDGQISDWSEPQSLELGLLHSADWAGQWIHLPTPAKNAGTPNAAERVTIDRAVYGVPEDAARQVDVTDRVRQAVADGRLRIEATNTMAGSDPAYGVVKSFTINYRIGDLSHRVAVRENETVDLLTGTVADGDGIYVPEYFRREFTVGEGVSYARLYVTARGLFEAHLNGAKIGRDTMTPGWSPYHRRIETLTYDVTQNLKPGENVLGIVIGEGWFAGRMMGQKNGYPKRIPAALLQLEVIYRDGNSLTIVSDGSWKGTRNGPLRYSNIYHGETYDAHFEMPGWDCPGFDGHSWLPVCTEPLDSQINLEPKRHHPVRVTRELSPIAITEPIPGHFVFDLGQNMVGKARIRMPVKANKTVTLRFAEMLEKNGVLYTANYRGAKSTDSYTAAQDGMVTWEPAFTFHGFRFVELSGLSPDAPRPDLSWVTGRVMHSDFRQVGVFASSDVKLNQLQQNITWGQRGNFLDIPTDCPQRNERLGWAGDAQVFCPTSLFNYDVHAFWAGWLQSVREDQASDGAVPDVIPNTLGKGGKPGWADVATVVPWEVYVRTGDLNVLRENYDLMKKHVAYYTVHAHNHILDVDTYGDWLQPYPGKGGTKGDTPRDLIGTAYWAHSADLTARAARALGLDADAKAHADLFDEIAMAFSRRFFDADARLRTPQETQTGYLLALAFELLPETMRAGAAAHLAEQVRAAGGRLRTGFLGTPLLAPVLDRFGYRDLAYGALFTDSYPSWFFSIDQGATTMWERWNSYSHEKGFGDPGMNSFNHYAYGAIGQWLYERLAGLAPDPEQPGYRHFYVQPACDGPLSWAEARLETPYGPARSAWKKKNDTISMDVTVPPNTSATVLFPSGAMSEIMVNSRPASEVIPDTEIGIRDGHRAIHVGPGKFHFIVRVETPAGSVR